MGKKNKYKSQGGADNESAAGDASPQQGQQAPTRDAQQPSTSRQQQQQSAGAQQQGGQKQQQRSETQPSQQQQGSGDGGAWGHQKQQQRAKPHQQSAGDNASGKQHPGQQQQPRQQQPGQQQPGQQQQPRQQQPPMQQQQQPRQQQPQMQQQQQQPGQQLQPRQQQPQMQQQQPRQQQPGQQQQPRQQQPQMQQQPRQQQQQSWPQQQPRQQQPQMQQQQSAQQQQYQQQPRQQPGQQQQYQQQQPWQQKPGQQQQPRQQQQYQRQQPGRPSQQAGYQRQPPSSSQPPSAAFSNLSLTPTQSTIPRGTAGQPGQVETNYLTMNLDKLPPVAFHYDVTIEPDRPKKFLRPAFDQFNRQFFGNIVMAYDGVKSCYTIEKLPCQQCEHEVTVADSGGRSITLKVTVKETDNLEIDLKSLKTYIKDRVYDKPMRAMQFLEVILASPCHSRGLRVGRSFFTKPKQFYDLNDGYEMWTGLYQACILGDQPFLNVDISHKSFPSESPLLDYISRNYRNVNFNEPLASRTAQELMSFLRFVNVIYEPPASFNSMPRNYRVHNITASANKVSFTKEDGSRSTVADYFQSRGYRLRYPNMNCLHVGSTVKANYVPIELCKIAPGQAINKKDGPRQVQQMIRFAATSTDIRKEKIMSMLEYYQHNLNPKIQKFGIQIGGNFIVVPTRLLMSPSIEYFAGKIVKPFNGSWRMDDATKFIQTKKPATGHKWAIIYSKRSRMNYSTLNTLAGMLVAKAGRLNMSLDSKPPIETYDRIDDTLLKYRQEKYDLVVVLLPFSGTSYADIKQSAELRHGVLTQCIKEGTVEKRLDDMLVLNLLLKINAKLNGANHVIKADTHVPIKNVMFLGADVTHPSPDERSIPSVVGVAASHDANGACYNMQYRLQRSTMENIEDMDSICTQHLRVYKEYQKRYPDNIIYYRDGVSDGQFPIIRDQELGGIRAACSKLGFKPKITCIIVVKRHHTRFFPKAQGGFDRNNKFNNVSPGTVVDRIIVHPNEVQFFMVSHQSIQGTAKPTRYNVIVDDAKFDIDLLQKLTYNLCHMFPRCNRVVSYPAPAYLAHLVAFRGRVYLEGQSNFQELKREYQKRLVNTDFMNRNPMYFV